MEIKFKYRYRGNRSDIDMCAHTFDGNRIGRERDAERIVTRKRVLEGSQTQFRFALPGYPVHASPKCP